MAFSIYDILNEADDEDSGTAQDAAPAEQPKQEEAPKDDDFSIDTSVGDDQSTDSGDDVGGGDGSDDMGGEDTGGGETGDPNMEEENENDKDIFLSLPKEEQQMKIRELKKLYGSLYTSCVDLVARIDDIEVSDDNKPYISRIYTAMCDIKTYIADYIIYIFPSRSYIENDIAYNTYLMMINSVASILDKIITKENKLREKEQDDK